MLMDGRPRFNFCEFWGKFFLFLCFFFFFLILYCFGSCRRVCWAERAVAGIRRWPVQAVGLKTKLFLI